MSRATAQITFPPLKKHKLSLLSLSYESYKLHPSSFSYSPFCPSSLPFTKEKKNHNFHNLMDRVGHSLPKRSYSSNCHKSAAYDDVFRGPPKLEVPALAPRLEDYAEIFGGFHSFQSSSIPVLDLPLLDDDRPDLHFDGFDYYEVFSGHRGPGLGLSFEDLVGQSHESSEDAWSPSNIETLSEESDPFAASDTTSQRVSSETNMSYHHKLNQTSLLDGSTDVEAVPVYTCILNEASSISSQKREYKKNPAPPCNINNCNRDFDWSDGDGQQFKRSPSKPAIQRSRSKPSSITVSDISLTTKPSRLPPPSRPPPTPAVKTGQSDGENSKYRAPPTTSYAFDRVKDESSSFASSTAEAMKHDAREPKQRSGGEQVTGKSSQKDHVKVEERTKKVFSKRRSSFEDNKMLPELCDANEAVQTKRFVDEDREQVRITPGEISTSHYYQFGKRSAAWREEKEYFEVTETNMYGEEDSDQVPATDLKDEHNKNFKAEKRADDKRKQLDLRGEVCGRDDANCGRVKESRGRTELQNNLRVKGLTSSVYNLNKSNVEVIREKSLIYSSKSIEKLPSVDEVEPAISEVKKPSEEIENGKGFTYVREDNENKDVEMREERDGRHEEADEQAEKDTSLSETKEQEEKKKKTRQYNENKLRDTIKHHESEKKSEMVPGWMERSKQEEFACRTKESVVDILMVSSEQETNALKFTRDVKEQKGGYDWEMIEKDRQINERKDYDTKIQKNWNEEHSERLGETEFIKRYREAFETNDNEPLNEDSGILEELSGKENKVKWDEEFRVFLGDEQFDVLNRPKFDEAILHLSPADAKSSTPGEVEDTRTAPSFETSHTNCNELGLGNNSSTKEAECSYEKEESMNKFMTPRAVKESVDSGEKTAVSFSSSVLQNKEDTGNPGTHQNIDTVKASTTPKGRKLDERVKNEAELEDERMRRIEEEREREREREKDRMAVDRAVLETASERSERTAVQRATAEVRQRAIMADARDKASRLKAERAAVERAMAEARQHALEKSIAGNASSGGSWERIEKPLAADRFSASSRFAAQREHTSFLPEMQNQGIPSALRYSYSSSHNNGSEGESPQRCKARLERYRRTAERAAKALAEKNMRDILAQREQEERNRVAETLDTEVKRWSSGKEGNLRALLSTLQYILGPDSGWQPVPLTEVITSAAVRKAYRKATLCVHPDKLQQRGATIQHKYICEKVFDLLKEAWNKFNSEER